MAPTSSFRVADDSFMTRQLDTRSSHAGEKMQPPFLCRSAKALWRFDMHDILLDCQLLLL